jgi:hypothetical protein
MHRKGMPITKQGLLSKLVKIHLIPNFSIQTISLCPILAQLFCCKGEGKGRKTHLLVVAPFEAPNNPRGRGSDQGANWP